MGKNEEWKFIYWDEPVFDDKVEGIPIDKTKVKSPFCECVSPIIRSGTTHNGYCVNCELDLE